MIELKTASPRRPRLEVLGSNEAELPTPRCARSGSNSGRCLLIRCPDDARILYYDVGRGMPQPTNARRFCRKLPAALWALWPSNSHWSRRSSAVLCSNSRIETWRANSLPSLRNVRTIRCRERRVGREECRVVGNVNPATENGYRHIFHAKPLPRRLCVRQLLNHY